jgi:predicted dehydrogenase
MAIETVAFIGSRGHYAATLREIERVTPALRVTALSPGGDRVDPLLSWCRQRGQTPRVFDDYRAMLDDARPDVAVVCGPFECHAEMCVEAIRRGIHVLTEKPAALTLHQLDALRAACRENPNVHLAGMMFSRYEPGFYTAWRLIQAGAIGDVRLINARKSYKLGTRDAYYHRRETYGGTIPWVGSHAIDWVMWYAGGARFETVYASHSHQHNAGNGTMERSAACHFTIEGDRFATVSIDFLRPATAPTHGDDWARIVGTDGVVEARPQSVTLINGDNDGVQRIDVSCDRRFMQDFVQEAERGSGALIDAASTLALTEACLRARESADQGRVVRFE